MSTPPPPPHHGTTLFISNLPYSATSTDLQTLFSDIAPVRSAFVVLSSSSSSSHPDGPVSKGVGYVTFAVREDAQSAFELMNARDGEGKGEGVVLEGRKLRGVWADSKPRIKDKDKDPSSPSSSKPKPKLKSTPSHIPTRPQENQDPLATRTIVVSGLPAAVDRKILWKKMRKIPGAEDVRWPIARAGREADAVDEHGDRTHVLFTSPSLAQDAISKLHAHVYKGALLSVMLKKRLDTVVRPASVVSHTPTPVKSTHGAAPNRNSRLIVRNLPFDADEQDLRALFLPHGPIHSVHVPLSKPTEAGEEAAARNNSGFAFVWMLSRNDAERAVEGCNGRVVRAGMAREMAEGKQKRKKDVRVQRKAAAAAEGERVIAVDWALSKDRWEKAKMDVDPDDDDDDDDGGLGVHADADADADTRDSDSDTPIKPTLPPPEAGTTLFIRNVPFQATSDDLRILFRAFGPLRYARVTLDPESGRSRGTGFVCFWAVEDAERAVACSDLLRADGAATATAEKANPFKLPSILTPDPSSSLAQNLVLHGRTLDVVRAVTRDEADKLKEEGEKKREKADKRNLYLLREGLILPNTPPSALLTPSDVEKRTASYTARRALLKSNPSLYVSRTRLSVRQVPGWVTERMMRRLATWAVGAFEEDVGGGRRVGLGSDEGDEGEGMEMDDKKKKSHKKPPTGGGLIKQSKLIRLPTPIDPLTLKGKSKGYGFIELSSHANALRVLRWANNNPDVSKLWKGWWREEVEDLIKVEKSKDKDGEGGERMKMLLAELDDLKSGRWGKSAKERTLIVEFSIENVQVVKRRQELQANQVKGGEGRKRTIDDKDDAQRTVEEQENGRRAQKRRRLDDDAVKDENADQKGKNFVGSIIGRKRRERMGMGKGGRSK